LFFSFFQDSFNERKEYENRQKEMEMYRALETWEEIEEKHLMKLFDEFQVTDFFFTFW
jgi:hypothetical protein